MADEETDITDSEIDAVSARTLVTGQSYSRPGFSKTNVPVSEIDRHLSVRRARRRARLGVTSIPDFS